MYTCVCIYIYIYERDGDVPLHKLLDYRRVPPNGRTISYWTILPKKQDRLDGTYPA